MLLIYDFETTSKLHQNYKYNFQQILKYQFKNPKIVEEFPKNYSEIFTEF